MSWPSAPAAAPVSPDACKGAPMLSLVMEGPAAGAVGTSARLSDLAGALVQEQRLIEELRQAILRQRAGMAAGDRELIDASDYAIARTRLTLEEARRRRAALAAAVVGRPGVALSDLELFVGVLPAPLLAAREAVHRAAEVTARDSGDQPEDGRPGTRRRRCFPPATVLERGR